MISKICLTNLFIIKCPTVWNQQNENWIKMQEPGARQSWPIFQLLLTKMLNIILSKKPLWFCYLLDNATMSTQNLIEIGLIDRISDISLGRPLKNFLSA